MEELYKYLQLLTEQQKVAYSHERQKRIERVNDEIERLLELPEPKMSDCVVASCDDDNHVTSSEPFKQEESPLRYAIMYQEDRDHSELHWFSTKEKRDEVIERLLETGEAAIQSLDSLSGHVIKPIGFTPVDLPKTFFRRKMTSHPFSSDCYSGKNSVGCIY